MRHLVAHAVGRSDFVDCALQVVADRRWGIEQNNSVPRGEKGRLIYAVRDPVEVLVDLPDIVTLSVESGPKC